MGSAMGILAQIKNQVLAPSLRETLNGGEKVSSSRPTVDSCRTEPKPREEVADQRLGKEPRESCESLQSVLECEIASLHRGI